MAPIPPPYDPFDDGEAQGYINRALRDPDNADTWAGLRDERYAEQTLRMLRFFLRQHDLTVRARTTAIEEKRLAADRGELDPVTFAADLSAYDRWYTNALHFQNLVMRQIDHVDAAAVRVRARHTGDAERLTEAIRAHERSARALPDRRPSKPDRLLWRAVTDRAVVDAVADLPAWPIDGVRPGA